MALSATIYKFHIHLSDFDRSYFNSVQLTVALHPSEKVERMLARVIAYCLHASEDLEFTKGLSTPETPDLWQRNLHGEVTTWIDVGEPSEEKIRKATRLAKAVWVYSFNSKSAVWWRQSAKAFARLSAQVRQLDYEQLVAFASKVGRTMELSVSITDQQLTLTTDSDSVEFTVRPLTSA